MKRVGHNLMKKYLFSLVLLVVSLGAFSAGAITCPDSTNFKLEGNICVPVNTGLSEKSVQDVVTAVLTWLLGIFGVLGVLTFVIAGILYFMAAGDAEAEKKAKNAMKMGIMGIVVGLAGFVVIQAIDAVLNAQTTF